jgi:hypothetical protein
VELWLVDYRHGIHHNATVRPHETWYDHSCGSRIGLPEYLTTDLGRLAVIEPCRRCDTFNRLHDVVQTCTSRLRYGLHIGIGLIRLTEKICWWR